MSSSPHPLRHKAAVRAAVVDARGVRARLVGLTLAALAALLGILLLLNGP